MYISHDDLLKARDGSDAVLFFEECLGYLGKIDIKKELDAFVNIFLNSEVLTNQFSESQKTELATLLRDKILEITFKNNDLPEFFYLKLYKFFKRVELSENGMLKRYADIFKGAIPSAGEYEYLYLNNMLFLVNFLNSSPKCLDEFLKTMFLISPDYLQHIGHHKNFIELVAYCDVTFDEFKEVALEIWDKEYYRALTPLQRRTFLNWCLHVIWNVPRFYNNPNWPSFYPVWKTLFYDHLERGEIPEAMYFHFYIYHKMGNSFTTQAEWKMFNDEICVPGSNSYKKWADDNKLIKCKERVGDGRRLIGFIWDRMVENSPFKVAYSLWKALLENEGFRQKYKIKVYLASYFEKSENDPACMEMVRKLGIEVFDGAEPFYQDGYYHNHLYKAVYIREQMIKDGVDIMIHGHGYDIFDFLVATRTAPKQIYWNHGNNMYDIVNIDMRITHCETSGAPYTFDYFTIPMDMERFYNPPMPQELIVAERAKYPKDAFILGSMGRLVKVDSDEYLETVAEIMKQNQNTIYIAAGLGNDESIRKKVAALGIADRFYFPGWVNPHIYGHIIDLYMDTFPLGSGESLTEYYSKGGVFVSIYSDEYIKKVNSQNMLNELLNTENTMIREIAGYIEHHNYLKKYALHSHLSYVCADKNEYIDRASHLIKDARFRDAMRGYLMGYMMVMKKINRESLVKKFEEFLCDR